MTQVAEVFVVILVAASTLVVGTALETALNGVLAGDALARRVHEVLAVALEAVAGVGLVAELALG